MTAIRLYIDEDASETAVVDGLRARGLDVLSTYEALQEMKSDSDQLAFAADHNRVIYTFNVRDFARLHKELLASGRQHAGIIAIPDQRISIGEKIRRVMTFVSSISADDMINRIEYL